MQQVLLLFEVMNPMNFRLKGGGGEGQRGVVESAGTA